MLSAQGLYIGQESYLSLNWRELIVLLKFNRRELSRKNWKTYLVHIRVLLHVISNWQFLVSQSYFCFFHPDQEYIDLLTQLLALSFDLVRVREVRLFSLFHDQLDSSRNLVQNKSMVLCQLLQIFDDNCTAISWFPVSVGFVVGLLNKESIFAQGILIDLKGNKYVFEKCKETLRH